MAVRLRSISRRIPWSLLLKAFLFAGSWLFFPFPVFLGVGLFFYFVPFFEPRKLGWPFFFSLVAGAMLPKAFSLGTAVVPNILGASLLFALFFLILGIKEFLFINRNAAYEFMVLILLFLVFVNFFSRVDSPGDPLALLFSCVPAVVSFFLIRALMSYQTGGRAKHATFSPALLAFLVWQCALVALFLPLTFLSQGALLFLATAMGVEIVLDHMRGGVAPKRLLGYGIIFVVFVIMVLGSVNIF